MGTAYAFTNVYNHLSIIDNVSKDEEVLHYLLNKSIRQITEKSLSLTKDIDSLLYFIHNELEDFIDDMNDVYDCPFYVWLEGIELVPGNYDYYNFQKLSKQIQNVVESFIDNLPDDIDKEEITIVVFEIAVIEKGVPIAVFKYNSQS